MNKEVKPTWNYILNDLALYSLFIKVAYSENVTHQDKIDLEHQIKLLQQKVNQLETNRDEAIEYINNCLIGYEEQYEEHTFNYPFVRYDLENFLEILERGKE